MNDSTFKSNSKIAYVPVVVNAKTKQTNADRIRAMTDEKLAGGMISIMQGWCPNHASDCKSTCRECLLDWLKQKVDNE